MSRRSGLTLVEILISLVLLTLVAATTLPFLRSASAALREEAPGDSLALAEAVDRFLAEAESSGSSLPQEGGFRRLEDGQEVAIRFRVLRAREEEAGAWISFESSGRRILRRLPAGASLLGGGS